MFQQMHADADKPFSIYAVRAAVDFINFEFAKLNRENASAGASFVSNSWRNALAEQLNGPAGLGSAGCQTEEQWIDLKPMFQQMHDALAGQFSGPAGINRAGDLRIAIMKRAARTVSGMSESELDRMLDGLIEDEATPDAVALSRALAIAKDGK